MNGERVTQTRKKINTLPIAPSEFALFLYGLDNLLSSAEWHARTNRQGLRRLKRASIDLSRLALSVIRDSQKGEAGAA